jgi:hypothetical protein
LPRLDSALQFWIRFDVDGHGSVTSRVPDRTDGHE